VLAARDLRVSVAWFVVVSAGTLLAALGLGTVPATAAALYYLAHSTFAAGAAFIAVECIARRRAGSSAPTDADYRIDSARPVRDAPWVAALFFVAALVVAGLPPGSGFIAKALLLDAAAATPAHAWIWSVVLLSGLVVVVALARMASAVFWRPPAADAMPAGEHGPDIGERGLFWAALLLVAGGLFMVLSAHPTYDFLRQTAAALGAA
jgi:multicomponent K+:H+ antiporter subunit D